MERLAGTNAIVKIIGFNQVVAVVKMLSPSFADYYLSKTANRESSHPDNLEQSQG